MTMIEDQIEDQQDIRVDKRISVRTESTRADQNPEKVRMSDMDPQMRHDIGKDPAGEMSTTMDKMVTIAEVVAGQDMQDLVHQETNSRQESTEGQRSPAHMVEDPGLNVEEAVVVAEAARGQLVITSDQGEARECDHSGGNLTNNCLGERGHQCVLLD